MSVDSVELLQQLVGIPSVNPLLESSADPSLTGEARLTDFLQDFVEQQGWPWLRQRVHPGRDNLLAICPGEATGPDSPAPILWEVHQDTVGIGGMKIDPFAAKVSDGKLWGRGACDVKGGMAAMLAALARRDGSAKGAPTIVLALAVNEECGFTGASALCDLWSAADADSLSAVEDQVVAVTLSLDELRAHRPSCAIIAEPTLLDVVVAHKGVVRWHCHTHGRAAHSAQPEQGKNAIEAMAEVIRAVGQYDQQVLANREPHPHCGRPTICVTTIQGGTGVNTVPDHAVLVIDRRLVPGEEPQQAFEELVAFVAEHADTADCRIEQETPWMLGRSLDEHPANRQWGEQVAAAARSAGNSSELIRVPYCTDASAIAQLGIPAIVFGPGSIDQAHTDDEWIALDQLERATEVLHRLASGTM